MSLIDVHFDMKDLQRVLGESIRHLKAIPMDVVAETLATAIDDEIQTEGRGRWADFSLATLKRHPKRSGGMLLQDTGLLANIQTREGNDWAEAISPAPYAGWHVTGTKNMPARNFLDIRLDQVLEEIAEFIVDEMWK